MKEKIKKIFRFLLNNWTKFAEIGTVIWAVNGIISNYQSCSITFGIFLKPDCDYPLSPVLAYFFSAVLILYLLRKYGKSNTPRT